VPHMMDDFPLLLSTLYDHAVRIYPTQEIVSVESDLSIRRQTFAETDDRIRRLATALQTKLGVDAGEAVGTFAWNNVRHHEIYWATANTGRICHTLNIRLFPEQLEYVINHGEDQVVFIDPGLVPLLMPLVDSLPSVRAYVVMAEGLHGAELPNVISYEDLIADVEPMSSWPQLEERSPMMYCYTSGTTGHPKGVAYTQRSTYLHTIHNLANLPINSTDAVLPVVPMFHAAAWGLTFQATTVGAKLVLPGPDMSAAGLVRLFHDEKVTFSAGVPTVWTGIQHYLADHPEADVSSIEKFVCGGSAVPRSMIKWFWENRGIRVLQGWGMTETNPIAAVAQLKPEMESWDFERQLDFLETAGIPVAGLQVKIVDDEGAELPHDGEAFGELLIRGPWIAAEYYNDPRSPESFVDGWLRTGDVCKITPEGYIRITDRAKDVIKSGGEWISSIDLENTLMGHPNVAEAAVVGVKHAKWEERPIAVAVWMGDEEPSEGVLKEYLEGKIAKWWMPDRIIFVDDIPKTGTGKFDKKVVRTMHADLLLGDN
jgi:fatty-acyl-CoA synthase